MAFKIVKIDLTDEQVQQIEKATAGDRDFALLAEPKLKTRTLNIQICTPEQFAILRPAILKAFELPEWKKK